MALPKINVPTYGLNLPSTQQEITYRPFLVKEEKILLTALQGGDSDEVVRSVKQIINNCIITEGVDVDKLAIYDLEYIFLQIRIRSVGNDLSLRFAPRKDTECEECKKQRLIKADLNEAKVVFTEGHSNKINLGDNLFLTMKYPGVKLVTNFDKAKESTAIDEFFRLIWECIESIHDVDKSYSPKDYTIQEGIAFLEELRQEQFAEIEKFFKTMPKLRLDVKVFCNKCAFSEIYPIVGLENFFV